MESNIEDLIKDATESIMISYKRGYEDGSRELKKDLENQRDFKKMLRSFAEFTKDYKLTIDENKDMYYANNEYIYTDVQLIKEFMLKYGY